MVTFKILLSHHLLGGVFPDNDQANDMYQNLLNQYSGIRDINQVNNTLSILIEFEHKFYW